jgi:hypothetical protein
MEIVGRRLGLILWDKDGTGDDEVWVHAGTVRASGSGLVLDRGEDQAPVKLLSEWLARIKPVSEDLRAVLSAGIILPLTCRIRAAVLLSDCLTQSPRVRVPGGTQSIGADGPAAITAPAPRLRDQRPAAPR